MGSISNPEVLIGFSISGSGAYSFTPLYNTIHLNGAMHWACRELLKEKKVAAGARWSKTKESLAGDKRYKTLSRDQREHIFRQYVAEQEVCTAAFTPVEPLTCKESKTRPLNIPSVADLRDLSHDKVCCPSS